MSSDFNPKQFFEAAIANGRLAHAYILQGHNTAALYDMALLIAQHVNCDAPQAPCQVCTSCRWIQQNAHPAVLTLSRLTYLVSDHGEDLSPEDMAKALKKSQPKQIKAEQIQRLIHQLGHSAPYRRVVIFTDVEERPKTSLGAGYSRPPTEWAALPGNEDKQLLLKPLHQGLFNTASANRFLKTLEEPPPNTLFFFLTDDTQNLLETIVSRCQTVSFPHQDSAQEQHAYTADDAGFLTELLTGLEHGADFYPYVDRFQAHFVADQGLTEAQAVTVLQTYLHKEGLAQKMVEDPYRFATYRHRQRLLEEASQRLAAKTNTTQTLNHLFWQWSVLPV